MPTVILAILIFGGVLAVGVYMVRFQRRKGEAMLAAWAAGQRLRILECQPANPPGTGPMHRNAADKQVVYRIKATDESGHVRKGTVRVGTAVLGVLSDEVAVDWDG